MLGFEVKFDDKIFHVSTDDDNGLLSVIVMYHNSSVQAKGHGTDLYIGGMDRFNSIKWFFDIIDKVEKISIKIIDVKQNSPLLSFEPRDITQLLKSYEKLKKELQEGEKSEWKKESCANIIKRPSTFTKTPNDNGFEIKFRDKIIGIDVTVPLVMTAIVQKIHGKFNIFVGALLTDVDKNVAWLSERNLQEGEEIVFTRKNVEPTPYLYTIDPGRMPTPEEKRDFQQQRLNNLRRLEKTLREEGLITGE